MRDGMWKGSRAFVVGGGKSLRGFDFSRLEGEHTVGCNMAFLNGTEVALIFDYDLMLRVAGDHRWLDYRGEKAWLNYQMPENGVRFAGVRELHECLGDHREPWWSTSLEHGLYRRSNCGPSAVNLAEVLGADPIYLLGFDMKGEGGKTVNYHDEYPEKQPSHVYNQFLADFEEIRAWRWTKASIVNLNPDSALRTFPFSTVDEVLR